MDEIFEKLRKLLKLRHGLIAPELVIADSTPVRNALVRLLADHLRVLIVADAASFAVAGHLVRGLPLTTGELYYQIFEAPAEPSMENAVHIVHVAREMQVDAVLAMGSGSISDISKLAAHELAVPLYTLATAASMNGYTAINASIMQDGFKQSFHTFLPKAVLADVAVLDAAPARMKAAGLADAAAATYAMNDWHLAHLVLGTEYAPELEFLFAADIAYPHPIYGLLVQGLAMTYAGSSAPASGGEHMLAHLVEMMEPNAARPLLHGEMIAHTLPLCRAHMHNILNSPTPPQLAAPGDAAQLATIFGKHWQVLQPIYEVKQNLLDASRAHINQQLATHWQGWKDGLQPSGIKPASAPSQQIPEIEMLCERWLPYARFSRNRFSFLDLEVSPIDSG